MSPEIRLSWFSALSLLEFHKLASYCSTSRALEVRLFQFQENIRTTDILML